METVIQNLIAVFPMEEEHRQLLKERLPGTQITFVSREDVTEEQLSEADVIFGNIKPHLLDSCPKLKWIHLASAGTDGYTEWAKQGGLLSNATGAYDITLPEHMLTLLMALNARLPDYMVNQQEHRWQRVGWSDYVHDSTILMLGAGHIGMEFLRRVKMMGAYTIGVRRTCNEKPDFVDELYTMEETDALLPRADVVAMALPNTPDTDHFMDRGRIFRMKPGAKLINCGRGNAVDQGALLDALRSNHLSGAAIDVASPEPLPEDSELWDVPNLLITPHVAGGWVMKDSTTSPFMEKMIFRVFMENLEDYLSGLPLRNTVDPQTGYLKR